MFMDAFLVVFIIQFLEFIETVHQMWRIHASLHKCSRTVLNCSLVVMDQQMTIVCYHWRLCPSRTTPSQSDTWPWVYAVSLLNVQKNYPIQAVVVQCIMNEALFSVVLTSRSCISCSFVASLITNTFSRLVDSCCCCLSFSPVSKSPASSSLNKKMINCHQKYSFTLTKV